MIELGVLSVYIVQVVVSMFGAAALVEVATEMRR